MYELTIKLKEISTLIKETAPKKNYKYNITIVCGTSLSACVYVHMHAHTHTQNLKYHCHVGLLGTSEDLHSPP